MRVQRAGYRYRESASYTERERERRGDERRGMERPKGLEAKGRSAVFCSLSLSLSASFPSKGTQRPLSIFRAVSGRTAAEGQR